MASIEENRSRYFAAAHAMQTGVAFEHSQGSKDQEPKHLRVGINTALCDHGALVKLLISKNIFTEEEYIKEIADMMEIEAKHYQDRINAQYPDANIILG